MILNNIHECPACAFSENSWSKIKYSLTGYDVYQCKRCEFSFILTKEGKGIEKRSERISSLVEFHLKNERRLKSLARKQLNGMLHFIKSPQNCKLIDIGCGNGYFLELARSTGMNVSEAEIDPTAAEFVKKHLGIKVYVNSSEEINASVNAQIFDIVTLWGVLEHIRNPLIAIQSIKKIMQKDGLLCIQTPSEDGLIRKVIHFYSKVTGKLDLIPELYNYEHVQCFSRKSITYFLERQRFAILKIESSSYGLKPLLQRPNLRNLSIMSVAKKILTIFVYSFGLMIGRGNHMTIYAKSSNS